MEVQLSNEYQSSETLFFFPQESKLKNEKKIRRKLEYVQEAFIESKWDPKKENFYQEPIQLKTAIHYLRQNGPN